MKRLRWYKTNDDGSYGAKIVLELPDHDHDYLCDLWQQLKRTPRASERWRPLFNELRTHLDLRAFFPGSGFVEVKQAPSPVPPAYLLRLKENQPDVLFDASETG